MVNIRLPSTCLGALVESTRFSESEGITLSIREVGLWIVRLGYKQRAQGRSGFGAGEFSCRPRATCG